MVRGVDTTLVGDLAHITPVAQKIAERPWSEAAGPRDTSIWPNPPLGPHALPVHFLEGSANGSQLQVTLEYSPHRLGFLRHDDELLFLVDVAKGNVSAHPEAFGFGGGNLVPNSFRDHLPLELSKGQQDVEGQSAHTV